MNDRNNTIAGWVLFAGIIALGASILTGEIFHAGRPDKMGYPIEGVEAEGEGGGEAAKPFEFYMASADVAKGEAVFKKCAACHNVDQGGANALGPNLWGVVGKPHGAHPGFAFTDALKGVPGNWDFNALDAWLSNPKKYAPGTKMTFAGLSNPQDRADVIAFLNSHGSNVPLPAAPAETGEAPAEGGDAAAPAEGNATAEAPAGNEAAPAEAAH